MALTTCAVSFRVFTDDGLPDVGATVSAVLNQYEIYNGYVVPELVTGKTNSNGLVVLNLWPNQLGSTSSMYTIKITGSNGKKLRTTAVVPNVTYANIEDIAELPAYEGKTEGQLILTSAVAAGALAVSKAAEAQLSANAASSSQSSSAASANASALSAANSASSATTSTTKASESAASATASAASAATATTKASEAAASAVSTALDRVQTGLDKVQTASDKTGTRSDSVQTALDRAATAANVVQTGSDLAATASNRVQTASDRVQTGLDRTQTGLDRTATASDRVQAGLDRTASDSSASAAASSATDSASSASTSTSQAAISTAQAVISTAQATSASTSSSSAATSATSASTSATTATTQAGIATTQASAASASAAASASNATAANTSAGASAGSAAQALAIYGSAIQQQAAVTAAQSAQSAAQGYAASAASVVTQDLSGVTAQALMRSSTDIITSLFVYDASKDSDGGAWTEKCQHTSWYNEPLNGKWLGAWDSELNARVLSASTFGAELTDTANTPAPWATNGNTVTQDGDAVKVAYVSSSSSTLPLTQVGGLVSDITAANKIYQVSFDIKITGGSAIISAQLGAFTTVSTSVFTNSDYVTYKFYIITRADYLPSSAQNFLTVGGLNSPEIVWIKNISVKEVLTQSATTNDYFQLTTDGKFYSLNKNLLTTTATLATQTQWLTAGTYTLSSTTASTGSVVVSGAATASHTAGTPTTFTVATSGNVVFTVTGSVLTAQCELGSSATTYSANTGINRYTQVYRGNTTKFPKLSAIVGYGQSGANYQQNIAIFDLTQPGFPMWMHITGNIYNDYAIMAPVNGASMMNGYLAYGCNYGYGGYAGSMILNFPADTAKRQRDDGVKITTGIALRNSGTFYTQAPSFNIPGITSGMNIARMAVMPDAPLDLVSGLPIPTIVFAGKFGVRICHADGTISINGTTIYEFTSLVFNKDIVAVCNQIDSTWYYWLNPRGIARGTNVALLTKTAGSAPDINGGGLSQAMIGSGRGDFIRAAKSATIQKFKNNEISISRGISSTITNTYNTGHLLGDIRRVYLADSVVESITGGELITNGTFDTDYSGWSAHSTATLTWVSGALQVDGGASGGKAVQAITTVIGKSYVVECNVTTLPTNRYISAGIVFGGGQIFDAGNTSVVSGKNRFSFIAVGTTTYISIGTFTNQTIVFDSVSVKQCNIDRTYKTVGGVTPNGATVYGTLTKALTSPSSTNQVVAYSGFSTANYLQEPYSADLDFGTGEWSLSAWLNVPTSALSANYPTYSSDLLAGAGAFTSSTGWVGLSADCTVSGGSLTKVGSGTHYVTYPLPALTLGDVVLAKFDVTSINGSFGVRIGHAANWNSSVYITTTGTQYRIFTAFNVSFGNVIGFDFAGVLAGTIQNLTVFKVKPSVIASRKYSSGAYFEFVSLGSNFLQAVAFDGTTTRTVTYPAFTGTSTNATITKDTWQKARAVYKTDGSLAITINGVQVAVTYGNPLLTLNNSNAALTIGNSYELDAPFPGSIALLKISATAPTQEQATYMYEQEKQMFRDGANCLLPDSGAIVDLAYDEVTDKWIAASATNESSWTGLVRTNVTAVPAGSNTKVQAGGGVKLNARSTTSPGVDVTIPPYGLREELVKRGEAAARLSRIPAIFDYVGGFTATTVLGNTAITAVVGLTYPSTVNLRGAVVTGFGIPANTTIVDIVGTTIYLSAKATFSNTLVQISLTDFPLPVGYEAKTVVSAGAVKREGATSDFTRLFDGFKETIRFGTAPGYAALVQIQAIRSAT